MKKYLQEYPWFVILLPIFYFIHFWREYFNLYTFEDLFTSDTCWILSVTALFLPLLLYRNKTTRKIAVIILSFGIVFFFFGFLLSFLKKYVPFLAHYRILLPLLFILFIGLAIVVWKSKHSFNNLFYYLNTLFFILIIYEILAFSAMFIVEKISLGKLLTDQYPISKNSLRPDIFFIIFDEYASSKSLKEQLHYDNSALDSFLIKKGFYYVWNSRSNYNSTPYSIGSILNMDYYRGLNIEKVNIKNFMQGVRFITNNQLCDILNKEGYKIYNCSYYDLKYDKVHITPLDLNIKYGLITYQTLLGRARIDIGWNLYKNTWDKDAPVPKNKPVQRPLQAKRVDETYKKITDISKNMPSAPVFLYGHFFLPHLPAIYDSTGRIISKKEFVAGRGEDMYISQLKYTNVVLKNLVNHLLEDARRPRIVIIQGDHGYRWLANPPHYMQFSNLNAMWFFDKKYDKLYDSISSVNTFRVILNTYFGLRIPLLKDSSIHLPL